MRKGEKGRQIELFVWGALFVLCVIGSVFYIFRGDSNDAKDAGSEAATMEISTEESSETTLETMDPVTTEAGSTEQQELQDAPSGVISE